MDYLNLFCRPIGQALQPYAQHLQWKNLKNIALRMYSKSWKIIIHKGAMDGLDNGSVYAAHVLNSQPSVSINESSTLFERKLSEFIQTFRIGNEFPYR